MNEQVWQLILSAFGIVLTAFMGYVIWLLKEQRKARIEEDKKRNANCEGTKLMLFYMLQRLHTEYTLQEYITYNQRETFREFYEAYHGLGGNGYGTKMWEDIKKLECRNEENGLTLYAQEYLRLKNNLTNNDQQ